MVNFQTFCTTWKNDVNFLINLKSPTDSTNPSIIVEQQKKTFAIAIRILSTIGMAMAVGLGAATAFTASTPVSAILALVTAVYLTTIMHDAYVISVNSDKNTFQTVITATKNFFEDCKDICHKKKNSHSAPRHPWTAGTLYRSAWDILFSKIQSV